MPLKVLTLNTWTGFDAHGRFRLGRYEDDLACRRRREALVDFVRHVDPDIVSLQEVFPMPGGVAELVRAIGGEFVSQVANAGVRLFGHGFPIGFSEGLVTVVRHGLSIKKSSSVKLSGPWTWFWHDAVAVQTAEARWLVEVEIAGYCHPLHVFNLHTHFSPPDTEAIREDSESCPGSSDVTKSASRSIRDGLRRRRSEIQDAFSYVHWVCQDRPALILGDLNMEPTDDWLGSLMRKEGLTDLLSSDNSPTWNPGQNPLAALSTSIDFPTGQRKTGIDMVSAFYDRLPKRVDYIFAKSFPISTKLINAHVAPAMSPEGVWFSDHSAVVAILDDTATSISPATYTKTTDPLF
jgi:endonuclease/exonuclease/phosphatase family metal-dependent hydrolase